MLTGDASQRAKIGSGKKSQSCYRCYTGPNHQGDNAAPCADARLVLHLSQSLPSLTSAVWTQRISLQGHVQGASDPTSYTRRELFPQTLCLINRLMTTTVAGMASISTALTTSHTLHIQLMGRMLSLALARVVLALPLTQSGFLKLC
jgi:hypothetical protein